MKSRSALTIWCSGGRTGEADDRPAAVTLTSCLRPRAITMLCASMTGKTSRLSSQRFTGPARCKPMRFDERREPAAAIAEFHELVKVLEFEHRLKCLAAAHFKSMCIHRVGDLLQVRRIEHGVIHFSRAGAGSANEGAASLPLAWRAGYAALVPPTNDQYPPDLESAGDLGCEHAHRHVSRDKMRANAVELLAWEVSVQLGGISNDRGQVRNPACGRSPPCSRQDRARTAQSDRRPSP